MSLYYPGYQEAKENVAKMDLSALLALIDDLYGRDNLKYGDSIEDVRAEAFVQLRKEWTDTSSKEYETDKFYQRLFAANR